MALPYHAGSRGGERVLGLAESEWPVLACRAYVGTPPLHAVPTSPTMYFSKFIKSNEAIDDLAPSNRAVVAGGTQGIGAGIAMRFALAGASVWVIGRSEVRGAEVVKKLEQASLEGARRRRTEAQGPAADHCFLRADLSDVQEVKRVAGEVEKRAGSQGVDWLFETQGASRSGRAV